MDEHSPDYKVSYHFAPTNFYAGLMVLAAELSGLSVQILPADSAVEIGDSALEYGRGVKEGSPEKLREEAEMATFAGGAVVRLQVEDPTKLDLFDNYYQELLLRVPPDCLD